MAIDKNGISTGRATREIVENIENELLLNYRKQFATKSDILIEKIDWDKWRTQQMQKFDKFKRNNKKILKSHSRAISNSIVKDYEQAYRHGINVVDKQIKKANQKGANLISNGNTPSFYKNPRITKQLKTTQEALNKAYTTASNNLENQFLTTVRTADKQPGVKTLFQSINSSTKTLAKSGIVGAVTSNSRKLNIANFIELSMVEGSQEILFVGEGMKNEEYNVHTVYVSQHESACPLCTPWQGKVLIDDVYQNGQPDGKHELLSVAIKAGLSHVNCRHNWVTYVEGVDIIPKSEKKALDGTTKRQQNKLYDSEKKLRYNERAVREWKRRESLALTEPERLKAKSKIREYQKRNINLVKQNEGLYRQYWREKPGFEMPKDVRWANLKYDFNIYKK